MGSREKPLFDLNEPAVEDESDSALCLQPQRAVPSTVDSSKSLTTSSSPHRTVNSPAFSHVSSVSSFQPFIPSKEDQTSEVGEDKKKEANTSLKIEKEEGEWSDVEDSTVANRSSNNPLEMSESNMTAVTNTSSNVDNVKNEDKETKIPTNPGKRRKLDQQKEAMLGKRRSRQTMFLNMEDLKQAGPVKISTPKKPNFLPPTMTRITKESRPLLDSSVRNIKQEDQSCNEGNIHIESSETKSDYNTNESDLNSGPVTRSKRIDFSGDDKLNSDQRQSSFKQPADSRQIKNPHIPVKKPPLTTQNDAKAVIKKLPSRKPTTVTTQYQDSSVERLLREVTNDKFWQHPGPTRIAEGIPASFMW